MTSMMAVLDVPPQSEEVRWCTVCHDKGIPSKLRPFQINLTEAVFMCPNTSCTYPMGTAHQPNVVQRDATKLKTSGKRKSLEDPFGRHKQRKGSRRISASAPVSACPSPCRSTSFSPPPMFDTLTDDSSMDSMFEYTTPNKLKTTIVANPGYPTQQVETNVHSDIILPNGNGFVSQTEEPKSVSTSVLSTYLHWWNKDALCWLDVALCILVHSPTVRKLLKDIDSEKNMLRSVVKAFDRAQLILNGVNPGKTVHLETSVGRVTVKTGGGDSPIHLSKCPRVFQHQKSLFTPNPEESISNELRTEPCDQKTQACRVMDAAREDVWHRLQPKIRCPRGSNDSPVFAIPLILRESAPLMQTFMVNYRWEMSCTECGYHHTDSVARCMPTFPNVTPDFTMTDGAFLRDCFMCPASNQRMSMKFNKMPPVLIVHFVEGLPHSDYASYDFEYDHRHFVVSAIIQFKNNPDHFVAWIRNASDATWMEVDDLRKSTASFGAAPTFPPSQVHIVMWEERMVPVRPPPFSPVSWVQHVGTTVTTVSVAGKACRTTPVPLVRTPTPVPSTVPKPVIPFPSAFFPTASKLPIQPASSRISPSKPCTPLAATQYKAPKSLPQISPKNSRRTPPMRHASLVVPCTDTGLSRIERLRQNAARLKALKTDSSSMPNPLALNLMMSATERINLLKVPTPKTPVPKTYLGALQPYLQTSEVKGSTPAVPGVSKVPKFQGFSFSQSPLSQSPQPQATKRQASVSTTAEKKIKKEAVECLLSSGKGRLVAKLPEPTKPVPRAPRRRQSRSSQKAGILKDTVSTCIPSGKGKGKNSSGKSKFILANEQQSQNNGADLFIRGDPAASRYVNSGVPAAAVTNPQLPNPQTPNPQTTNPQTTKLQPTEVSEDEACSIIEAATIIASITSPELVLKDSPKSKTKTEVKRAATLDTSLISDITDVSPKNPILDLFDDMNFGANIDFTDLNFHMDDFLV